MEARILDGILIGGAGNLRLAYVRMHPFVEVGFAESSGRWDAGGLFVNDVYEPSWINVSSTGLAVGAGVTLDVIILPHLILEGVVGYWSVPDPFSEVPPQEALDADFPLVYYGLGIRFGF